MNPENILSPKMDSRTEYPIELKINYQNLSEELIKELRGKVSQRQLSEDLGFSFNQIGKWESGATLIKWEDFLALCEILKVPIEKSFRYAFWNLDTDFNSMNTLKAIIQKFNLIDNKSLEKQIYKKWQTGETTPTLADVLKIIGTKSPTLFGWLSLFIDCSHLLSLKKPYEQFLKNMGIVLSDPITVYVNAALQVEEYKKLEFHNSSLLAEHATCNEEQLNQSLLTLVTYGLVHFDGKKYQPSSFDFSFSGLRHPKLRGLTKYTTQLTAARYSMIPVPPSDDPIQTYNPSQSSVRVTALSAAAAKKVVDLIVQFHNQVDEVVKADHLPKDNVQIILVHSFASNINSPNPAKRSKI